MSTGETSASDTKDTKIPLPEPLRNATRRVWMIGLTIGVLVALAIIYFAGGWAANGTYHGVQIKRSLEFEDTINQLFLKDSPQEPNGSKLVAFYEIKGPDLEFAWLENGKLSPWYSGMREAKEFVEECYEPDAKITNCLTQIAIVEHRSEHGMKIEVVISPLVKGIGRGKGLKQEKPNSFSNSQKSTFSSSLDFVPSGGGSSGRIDDTGTRFIHLHERSSEFHFLPIRVPNCYVIWNQDYTHSNPEEDQGIYKRSPRFALVARRSQQSESNEKNNPTKD